MERGNKVRQGPGSSGGGGRKQVELRVVIAV